MDTIGIRDLKEALFEVHGSAMTDQAISFHFPNSKSTVPETQQEY